ncbi:type II toxin-antitoxin system HicB family antitoxin [Synechocystis salina LEGE 06099]|uniref:type II toxin-antitoxin system HicB family antitoxin n=1 Tax=Synechocystis salina TaxID=945780 RepID=UPI0018801484|nr:type II toxin-antitoxin system HicB family antitoxin [Synechocystis salina]MBE9204756.1 type II toxin-antitoxin system HicB family antitoxin [Synechocystis salina LEGE 06099]
MRQIILYPGEDGYWIAQCSSLPACISQGQTKQEAILNIKEAIELYLEILQEEGRAISNNILVLPKLFLGLFFCFGRFSFLLCQ